MKLITWSKPPKKRINWKKELRNERNKVIAEAINAISLKINDHPKEWRRGYYSAITTLELMKND